MANAHKTLASLFTDTANVIRAKTGSSAPIIADNLPSAVSGIITLPEGSADATATGDDLVSGRTAYARGQKITGAIPVNGDGLPAHSCGINGQGLFYYIPRGYYNGGNPWVYSSPQSVANAIGLTANKIVSGNTILGIAGTGASIPAWVNPPYEVSLNGVETDDYNLGLLNYVISNTTDPNYIYNHPVKILEPYNKVDLILQAGQFLQVEFSSNDYSPDYYGLQQVGSGRDILVLSPIPGKYPRWITFR